MPAGSLSATMPLMPGPRLSVKGSAALVVAVVTVVVLLILLPVYRIFFAISLGIAIIVVAILHFWHKLRPVRLDDPDDKHPLKLS
jgi:dolichol kinase